MSAAKPERKSMRGMGADAFFGPPVDQPTIEEASQDTSKPVSHETTAEVNQDIALPDYPWDSVEVESDTSVEGYQDTSIPVQKQTNKAGKKHRGKPVQQDASGFMKASYYITVEDDLKLENIRLARRKRGIKVDKSALIREAIAKLKE